MSLSVDKLCISRAGVPLLRDVSFEIAGGTALLLRGSNGIGKTTLLRTIAGLQAPDNGSVICEETELALGGHLDAIKLQLTVAENLKFWAEVYGSDIPEDVWEEFDLVPLRDRLANTLSAGQKRRLGLARLRVIGRKIWLLDEPTTSLDAGSVAALMQVIKNHLSQGGSALIATHVDLDLPAEAVDLEAFQVSSSMLPKDEDFL